MNGRAPRDILRLAGERACELDYAVWRFGEGIAMEGLLAAARLLPEPRFRARVTALMEHWLAARGELVPTDHTAAGTALVELYRETGDPRYLRRARQLAALLLGAPRHPAGVHLHVRAGEGWQPFAWVDCMHTDAPFLAHLAAATGEAAYFDGAADVLLAQVRAFQDPRSGLFSHGFDCQGAGAQGVHWGRGNGWALLGLVGTLQVLPAAHPACPTLLASLQGLAAALPPLQCPDGHFRTVLDDPLAPVEYSVAAFVAAGFGTGARAGLLPGACLPTADRAWAAAERATDPAGRLETSVATAASPDPAWYRTRPTAPCVAWGQGPLLLAAAARLP